jgi:hypothetical protein
LKTPKISASSPKSRQTGVYFVRQALLDPLFFAHSVELKEALGANSLRQGHKRVSGFPYAGT